MGQMLLPHRKGISLDATSNLDDMTNNCGPPHQTSVNTRHDSAHLDSPRYNNEIMDDSEEIRYPKRKRQEVSYYDDDDDSGDYEDLEEELEIKVSLSFISSRVFAQRVKKFTAYLRCR